MAQASTGRYSLANVNTRNGVTKGASSVVMLAQATESATRSWQESHHAAGGAAGSAADQNDARSNLYRHRDKVGQRHRDQQHDEDLCQHPQPDITRAPGNLLTATAREGQPQPNMTMPRSGTIQGVSCLKYWT